MRAASGFLNEEVPSRDTVAAISHVQDNLSLSSL